MDLQAQVKQAVQVLNHDVLSCNRVAANQWLVQFQQTDTAWEIASSILTAESLHMHNFEVELFAAQILKRKIHNDAGNLQPDRRSALQNALLISASKYSSGPPQLLTQICLALSALVVRATDSGKLTDQLFPSLRNLQYQGTGRNAVLELLTVLPEELTEYRAAGIDSAWRWKFSQELLSNTTPVLEFLLLLIKDESVDHHQRHKILRCLLSWVRIGCFLEIGPSSLQNQPLIGFVYSSLQVPQSFDVSIEVLAELINRHETFSQDLLPKMVSVKDAILLPALSAGNETIIKGLCWLMAELGQTAPGLIVQGSLEAISLTDALLRCVTYQSSSWDIAEATLPFWCALGEYILSGSIQDNVKQMALATYGPVYIALLDAFVLRTQVGTCEYSKDDLDGSTGLPDGLAQFRVNLEETLATVCRLLGSTQYVTQLLTGTRNSYDVPWQVVEAQLFLLYLVSDVVLDGPRLDLSSVVHVLLVLHARPMEHVPGLNLVHKSAAQVIGAYAKWVCIHPSAVLALLSFLASGLNVRLASTPCAIALRRISEEVSGISDEPANLECLLWIGEGLHNLQISLQEEEEVVCAVARALSTVGNSTVVNDALHRILQPCYESLKALLVPECEMRSSQYVLLVEASIRSLHRLGILFSQLPLLLSASSGGDLFLGILAQFWPLLKQIVTPRYMEHNGLAVAACKSLSAAMQTGGQHLSLLLPEIMGALSESFVLFQTHVCFIKLAIISVEEFGQEQEYGPLFLEMLRIFSCTEAVKMLNSSYACDQEPDLAEAYMNFMSAFVRCCPKGVVAAADPFLEASLNKATICCTAMHQGAAVAAMSYMSSVLEAGLVCTRETIPESSLTAIIVKICLQCGESIVSGMLYALLGSSAMKRVYKATTILQQLAAICEACEMGRWNMSLGWECLQCWINSAVQALPSEYLREGEGVMLATSWLEALKAAAMDQNQNQNRNQNQNQNHQASRTAKGGYLNGDGGRSLKRVLRDFADQHRLTNPISVPS